MSVSGNFGRRGHEVVVAARSMIGGGLVRGGHPPLVVDGFEQNVLRHRIANAATHTYK